MFYALKTFFGQHYITYLSHSYFKRLEVLKKYIFLKL